jgi:hypothetical protein
MQAPVVAAQLRERGLRRGDGVDELIDLLVEPIGREGLALSRQLSKRDEAAGPLDDARHGLCVSCEACLQRGGLAGGVTSGSPIITRRVVRKGFLCCTFYATREDAMDVETAMSTELENALEALIDAHGLYAVTEALAEICLGKSEHLATNRQDAEAAKRWAKAALTFDRALGPLRTIQGRARQLP